MAQLKDIFDQLDQTIDAIKRGVPLKLAPETEALLEQVLAQPQRKMTWTEIEAWAKRLAAEVANLTD